MKDRLTLTWMVSGTGTIVTLVAFLTAYTTFGHVVLGNISYFAVAFMVAGFSFLMLTLGVVVRK